MLAVLRDAEEAQVVVDRVLGTLIAYDALVRARWSAPSTRSVV